MSKELVEARPFLVMDKQDEKQVIAEMSGEIMEAYVYSYTQGNKVVEGLSLAGINAVAIHMAETGHPIRVINQWITEDEKYIKAIVKVGRFSVKDDCEEVMLDSTLGAKRQPRYYSSGIENPFAYELAITKAERNARKKLMPEKIIMEMMKEYKKQGKVEEVEYEPQEEENEIEAGFPGDEPQDKPTGKKTYPISPNQRKAMEKNNITIPDNCSYAQASKLIKESIAKSNKKLTRGDGQGALIPEDE